MNTEDLSKEEAIRLIKLAKRLLSASTCEVADDQNPVFKTAIRMMGYADTELSCALKCMEEFRNNDDKTLAQNASCHVDSAKVQLDFASDRPASMLSDFEMKVCDVAGLISRILETADEVIRDSY